MKGRIFMGPEAFRLAYDVRMEAESTDTAEVLLYGEIMQNEPELWKKWLWTSEDKCAADFNKEIKEIRDKGATKLLLRINSPGGVCTEAVAMRSILANAGFDEINIRIEGLCASAATMIATIPNAHVSIAEGSEFMIHNPWTVAFGNANEMEKTIERLRNIEKMSRGFYAAKSGQEDDQLKQWMDAETWFTADEAVEYGFCDELLKAEAEAPIAASVSPRVMAAMKGMYKTVPTQIKEQEENAPEGVGEETAPAQIVSNETPVAGASSEHITNPKEEETMDIKDINIEQLSAENPALLEQIQQNAVATERQRQEDIDALTIPGYEDMAAEAKNNGTSVIDFQKSLVAAMKQKGTDFLAAREKETQPAQDVAGEAPTSGASDEQKEIEDNAKAIAEYAKSFVAGTDNGMF